MKKLRRRFLPSGLNKHTGNRVGTAVTGNTWDRDRVKKLR